MRQTNKISLIGSLALALVVSLAGSAAALPPGIYATPTPVDNQDPKFEKILVKAKKNFVVQENGKWHFYFVAYLNKPAPADQVNIVFYDAKAKGPQEPNAFPVSTRAGAKIIASEVTVSPEDGIKPGPFNVKITVLDKGKEVTYAQTKLELKPPAAAK